MTAPEVTREEADPICTHRPRVEACPSCMVGELRQALRMFDGAMACSPKEAWEQAIEAAGALCADLADADERLARHGCTIKDLSDVLIEQGAMRECIDRLRDGWEPGEFTERQGIPFGWCWHKTTYDNGRVTFYERHAMSPEQQAVMARG